MTKKERLHTVDDLIAQLSTEVGALKKDAAAEQREDGELAKLFVLLAKQYMKDGIIHIPADHKALIRRYIGAGMSLYELESQLDRSAEIVGDEG